MEARYTFTRWGDDKREDICEYSGTVYVEWKDRVRSDGTVERYATGVSGDREAGKSLRDIIETKGVLKESDVPSRN